MKPLLIGFLVLPLLLAGCSSEKTAAVAPEMLIHTVALYNELLAQGYRDLNMNPLVQAATEERATKAYYHMSALGEERKRMEANLKELSFLETQYLSPEEGKVRTQEEWDYTHVNIDTQEEVFHESITYQVKYRLILEKGRWLVADIVIEKETASPDQPVTSEESD